MQIMLGAWGSCELAGLIFGFGGFRVGGMKSKQLANVLIKLLGLSLCAQGVGRIISTMLNVITMRDNLGNNLTFTWDNGLSGLATVAIGILFICKSLKFAEWMFQNETE